MRYVLLLLFVLVTVPAVAQVQTPAVPTDVDIIVIDPITAVAVANGTRRTALAAGSAICNQPALPVPPPGLTNPTIAEIPDPFTAGRFCRPPMPINLATAPTLRVVAVFNSSVGVSGRSPVGVLPFGITPILVPPAPPASVEARP